MKTSIFAAAYSNLLGNSIILKKYVRFQKKMQKGEPLKVIVIGDSIIAGSNAHPKNTWF